MQAIVTRYLGPTNYRGSRIKARCDAGSITIPYPYELSGEAVHRVAAEALRDKMGWTGALIGGGLPDDSRDSYAFVFVSERRCFCGADRDGILPIHWHTAEAAS